MRSLTTACVAIVCAALGGCSLVNDPGRFMSGDAGARDGGADDGGARDAGADAEPTDGGIDAGPRPDAGPPRPAHLRILNAVEVTRDGEPFDNFAVDVEGAVLDADFGCGVEVDSFTGDVSLTVTVTDAPAPPEVASLTIDVTGDSFVVLARDNVTGAIRAYTSLDVPPARVAGRDALEVLHVLRQTATTGPTYFADNAGEFAVVELPFGRWSDRTEFSTTTPAAVGLGYGDGWFGLDARILATFTLGVLTASGYYILTGTADVHPSLPGGPRAIFVPATGFDCNAPRLPDAVVALANFPRAGAPAAHLCQSGSTFPAVRAGANEASNHTTTFGGLTTFLVHGQATEACIGGVGREVSLPTLQPGRRYLVVATGTVGLDVGTWTIDVLEEAAPAGLSQMGLTLAHLAPSQLLVPVDVRRGGLVYTTDLAHGDSATTTQDTLDVDDGLWEVLNATTDASLARFQTALFAGGEIFPDDYSGGAFFVLFDRQDPTVENRAGFVLAPYGRLWTGHQRAPAD